MKKSARSFFLLIFALVFLGACAARPSKRGERIREELHPEPYGPSAPFSPTPPGETPPVPEGPRRTVDKPHITLVLGGAGVASFATVGLLKKLHDEGIVLDAIVASGWPAVFALGYGFLRSVHDLEWFATRLKEKDFSSEDRISSLIETSFRGRDLSETRVPVILSNGGESQDRGDWREPLLKALSGNTVPGMDIDEALRRNNGGSNGGVVVSVQMYGDYLGQLKESSEQAYVNQLRQSVRNAAKSAQLHGEIALGRSPKDFSAKRAAFQAGAKEGTRLARALQQRERR